MARIKCQAEGCIYNKEGLCDKEEIEISKPYDNGEDIENPHCTDYTT